MRDVTFRYLTQEDVLSLKLGFDEILSVIERALVDHGKRSFEMPPKPGIHPLPGAFIHAMPSFLPNFHAAGLKWVSGFPQNRNKDYPSIVGLMILNDPETGIPLCIMDATWITTVRTAAVSALASRHLCREGSSAIGIIGAGVQGRYHAEMILHVLPHIRKVYVFDIQSEQQEIFCKHIQNKVADLAVHFAPDPRTIFEKADLVVTATGRQERPVVKRTWLLPGRFYIGIESFRYWDEDALLSTDKFITDDWAQAKTFMEKTPHINLPLQLYAELGEILLGEKPGREQSNETIVCIFVGIGLADLALADLIYRLASEKGLGEKLRLGRF